jgi:CelD/BcsL family acetyltransferase involved in cellulose biosynthesis
MELKILRKEAQWLEIAEEWNELLEKSINDVPFLRYEYLAAWWQFRGGGEWPKSELYIIAGRGQNGELLGIAPFFITKNSEGKDALMFLGSIEISDFLDLIVDETNLEAFVDSVLYHLLGEEAPAWEVIDLYNILEDSPSLRVIDKLSEKHLLNVTIEREQPAPFIELPNDFDDYLAGLEKKYRHEFRRKLRNAGGFFIPVSWEVVEEEEHLDEALDRFTEMMRMEKEKKAFLTDEMVLQMKAIAHAFFKTGILQLAFLKVGKDYAGGYFNLVYKNRVWVYNSGMGIKYANLSPGIVLTGFLLMDAIEKGIEVFDMMRGDEEYKYHLGGVDRFVMRAQISRK